MTKNELIERLAPYPDDTIIVVNVPDVVATVSELSEVKAYGENEYEEFYMLNDEKYTGNQKAVILY